MPGYVGIYFQHRAACKQVPRKSNISPLSFYAPTQNLDASQLQQIREVIDVFPGMKKRIISSNVEELMLQPMGTTAKKDISRCFSYPSSVKGKYIHCLHAFLVPGPFPSPALSLCRHGFSGGLGVYQRQIGQSIGKWSFIYND
jgi:hypothetical protein